MKITNSNAKKWLTRVQRISSSYRNQTIEYFVNLLTDFYMMRVLVINQLTPGVQLHCGKNIKTLGLNIILQFFRKLKIPWDLHNNSWGITKILGPSFFFSKEIGYGSLINRAFCNFSFSYQISPFQHTYTTTLIHV